jgi:hypothetical protein
MMLLAAAGREETHANVADARPDHYFARQARGQWQKWIMAEVDHGRGKKAAAD